MEAMMLSRLGLIDELSIPLDHVQMDVPEPKENELLLNVLACGVCHTELDEIEGRTPSPDLLVIPGHQVVRRVVATGQAVSTIARGARLGSDHSETFTNNLRV